MKTKTIIYAITIIALTYLLMSFVEADLKFWNWNKSARVFVSITNFLLVIIIISKDIFKEDKK